MMRRDPGDEIKREIRFIAEVNTKKFQACVVRISRSKKGTEGGLLWFAAGQGSAPKTEKQAVKQKPCQELISHRSFYLYRLFGLMMGRRVWC